MIWNINLNGIHWFDKLVAQCTPHYTRFDAESANASLEKLERLMRELQHRDNEIRSKEKDKHRVEQMLMSMADNIEDPVWAKDVDNNFMFVNQSCCDKILRRDRDSVLSMTDADFKGDALAKACVFSDEITKSKMRSCRFIESAVFDDGCFWFEVVKSPWRSKGQLIGTVGTARDITYLVPDDIECECKSIEIPIDWKLSGDAIRELCG